MNHDCTYEFGGLDADGHLILKHCPVCGHEADVSILNAKLDEDDEGEPFAVDEYMNAQAEDAWLEEAL